jgi:hypothetical protein
MANKDLYEKLFEAFADFVMTLAPQNLDVDAVGLIEIFAHNFNNGIEDNFNTMPQGVQASWRLLNDEDGLLDEHGIKDQILKDFFAALGNAVEETFFRTFVGHFDEQKKHPAWIANIHTQEQLESRIKKAIDAWRRQFTLQMLFDPAQKGEEGSTYRAEIKRFFIGQF